MPFINDESTANYIIRSDV